MKNPLKMRLFFPVLMLLALCACQGRDPSGDEGEDIRPVTHTRQSEENLRIAARVGEGIITYRDVRYEAVQQGVITPETPVAPGDGVFDDVLEQLIDQRLLAIEARRRGLDQRPEAARRLRMAQERILGNYLMETMIAEAVSEEAIEEIYDQQSRLAPRRTEVRARHILLSSREEIEEAIRLLDAGQDFAALARQVSQDPATRFNGGDLGYFTRSGILAAFAETAFNTEVGQISEPFQSEFGWHVLKVEGRRQQPRPSLDEMRGSIVRFLTFDQIEALLDDLRQRYDVEVEDPAPIAQPAASPQDPNLEDDDSLVSDELDAPQEGGNAHEER